MNALATTAEETAATIIKHFAEENYCLECGIHYFIIPIGVKPYMNSAIKSQISMKGDWAFEDDNARSISICDDCATLRRN
jgi:hypothetical protein